MPKIAGLEALYQDIHQFYQSNFLDNFVTDLLCHRSGAVLWAGSLRFQYYFVIKFLPRITRSPSFHFCNADLEFGAKLAREVKMQV